VYAHDLSVQQKCSNHALSNLLFSLCKFLWIIDSLVVCPRPHFETLACPCTPKLLQTKEHTQLLLPLFSLSNLHLSLSRNVGVRQFTTTFVIISNPVNYFKQQINLIQYFQLNLILLGVQRSEHFDPSFKNTIVP
jgi:hypothetical protein